MKRSTLIFLTVFSLIGVAYFGLMGKDDHRTDRNVPGATTSAGKAPLTESQPTYRDRGLEPPPR